MRYPMLLAVPLIGILLYACKDDSGGFLPNGDTDNGDPIHGTDDSGDTGDTSDTETQDTTDTSEDTAVDTAPPFTGDGYSRGDTAYNIVVPDQDGDLWRLYQQTDGPLVISFGYAQSYNFQVVCQALAKVQSAYSSHDVQTVAVIFLDASGTQADVDDAKAWANEYGLKTVLYDPDYDLQGSWANTSQVKTYIIDEDMEIRWDNLEATTQQQLEDQLHSIVY